MLNFGRHHCSSLRGRDGRVYAFGCLVSASLLHASYVLLLAIQSDIFPPPCFASRQGLAFAGGVDCEYVVEDHITGVGQRARRVRELIKDGRAKRDMTLHG